MEQVCIGSIRQLAVEDTRLRLDRLDIKILAALQSDGRMSNLKLSELVALSPTPCLQRVRRLENAGFIVAYGATLDARKFAPHITVHTDVTLRRRTAECTQRFERYVRDEQFIVECYLVSGGFDYVLKVVARDVDHYRGIMEDMLAAEVGVDRFSSFISLQQIKQSRGFPLGLVSALPTTANRKTRAIRRG
ncbi:Lrp/AsnC family transcriptional regulator [Bradyrhizobium sp. CCBAU 53338]|uniref:Lrp/AsnC family transcriptional regulator n=1 Tax=Bradyrhizobium sp. CCBAU 53338 TaxID=1325111 RepID=UPI00188C0AA3|nr:Lrp/AsnC family transcriptional regulator [Bradyrhizobium sp. CCBAU 53338]QOZ51461.1 Lrp/AsnC family transcriptional regulator [Bradyrhizobium sp. CCBAU 53338]